MIVARPVGQYDGIVSLKGGKGKDGSRWTNARKLVKKPHTHVPHPIGKMRRETHDSYTYMLANVRSGVHVHK